MIYRLITKLLLVALTLILLAEFVPGVDVDGVYTAIIVALLLGVINLFIRPVLFILTLPVTILTFGLFSFVLNALLFWFVATFVDGFSVDGFIPAFLGAFAISIVGWLGNKFLK